MDVMSARERFHFKPLRGVPIFKPPALLEVFDSDEICQIRVFICQNWYCLRVCQDVQWYHGILYQSWRMSSGP